MSSTPTKQPKRWKPKKGSEWRKLIDVQPFELEFIENHQQKIIGYIATPGSRISACVYREAVNKSSTCVPSPLKANRQFPNRDAALRWIQRVSPHWSTKDNSE